MATPGQPFDTEERDQLRSRQRRLLRMFDDWFVERIGGGVRPPEGAKSAPDREVYEEALREEVRRRIDNEGELVDDVEAQGLARAMSSLLNQSLSGGVVFQQPTFSWEVFGNVPDPEPKEVIPHQGQDQDTFVKLIELVGLLIAADDWAGDYVDPRVEKGRGSA